MPETKQIRTGARVHAIGGHLLGRVVAVGNEKFAVAIDGTTLWLPIGSVFTATPDVVTLIYERAGVLRNGSTETPGRC